MKFRVKESSEGLGIFASIPIKSSEIIGKLECVREITADKPRVEGEKFEHQIYYPNGQVFLVAAPYCYFNHSCEPNGWLFSANQQYYIIAKRDIENGEEITIDYELSAVDAKTWLEVCGGDPSIREPEEEVAGDEWECECGAENCRGMHKWNFFTLSPELILKSLPYLDPWFVEVHGNRIGKILNNSLKR